MADAGPRFGQAPGVKPQVYLLFMVYSSINHLAIWERFLDGGIRGVEYTALVHCKSEADCRKSLGGSTRFLIVPSVQTSYCHDLVSGMNALLRTAVALGGIGNPNDKFVFVSDSTLPVKPFSYVWRHLTADQGSDFCIFPRNEWAEVHPAGLVTGQSSDAVRIAPKHHQWIVLSRKHAELSVERSSLNSALMHDLQLNTKQANGALRNTGCLDEYWHFATLFSRALTKDESRIDLEGFNGGPLDTRDFEIQGRCDTFVQWIRRASGITNNLTRMAQALMVDVGTDLVPATDMRPGTIYRFGRAALRSLRHSSFLFVRKVAASAIFSGCESLEEAFSKFILRDGEPVDDVKDEAWPGAGIWLDNQQSRVSISSIDGAVRLEGEHRDMQAKGFFCGDRLEVTFSSGYRTKAVLSADRRFLHWANGVVWPRLVPNH